MAEQGEKKKFKKIFTARQIRIAVGTALLLITLLAFSVIFVLRI